MDKDNEMLNEPTIRAQERARIARHLAKVGKDLLHDETSDAFDGYVAGVLIDLAKVIEHDGI